MTGIILDNGVGRGQPQAAAFLLGGKIRVEDLIQIIRSDAIPSSTMSGAREN